MNGFAFKPIIVDPEESQARIFLENLEDPRLLLELSSIAQGKLFEMLIANDPEDLQNQIDDLKSRLEDAKETIEEQERDIDKLTELLEQAEEVGNDITLENTVAWIQTEASTEDVRRIMYECQMDLDRTKAYSDYSPIGEYVSAEQVFDYIQRHPEVVRTFVTEQFDKMFSIMEHVVKLKKVQGAV